MSGAGGGDPRFHDGIERTVADALHAQSCEMFPEETPVPPLGETHRAAAGSPHRKPAWPWLAAAAVVAAVTLITSAVVAGRGHPTGPAAAGIQMGPPCTSSWVGAASTVQFTVDPSGPSVWHLWEQGEMQNRRFCLWVDAEDGAPTVSTSVDRDGTQLLQGAGLVTVDGRSYVWGVVTPAVTHITASGGPQWSTTWSQQQLHFLPSALGVFVTPIDNAKLPITVRAVDESGQLVGERVVPA